MLFLDRYLGQSIVIDVGGKIVTVTPIKDRFHGNLRIAIEAPREVTVLRGELREKQRRGNE